MPAFDDADKELQVRSKKRKISSVRAAEFLNHTLDVLYPPSPKAEASYGDGDDRGGAMSPKLTLYGDLISANTRIVTLVMEFLGLDYEFRHIDVMQGDNLSLVFQKVKNIALDMLMYFYTLLFEQISPRGVVPILADGTFHLSEARAIATYLINQVSHSALLTISIHLRQ